MFDNDKSEIMKIGLQVKKFVRQTYERLAQKRQHHQCKFIKTILSNPCEPAYYDSKELFNRLQSSYPPWGQDYKYDPYSTWERGILRARELLKKLKVLRKPGLTLLDAGCGDGMTGYVLASYGHNVMLADIDDRRDDRSKDLPFFGIDLCAKSGMKDNEFDIVFSYNTFEHLYAPEATLCEIVRVCKTGGYIYLAFGPLYASPWGLHAYSTIHMPYSQFFRNPLLRLN